MTKVRKASDPVPQGYVWVIPGLRVQAMHKGLASDLTKRAVNRRKHREHIARLAGPVFVRKGLLRRALLRSSTLYSPVAV